MWPIAGSAVWIPASLGGRLREYVEGGGQVASFGADALRRTARLDGDVLADPSPPRPANVFGERTELVRTGAAPLSVSQDELGLFDGLSSLIGEFTLFERSVALPTGSTMVVAAGREPDQPALVAFRRGDGLVLRTGTPQWTRELNESRAEHRGAGRDEAHLEPPVGGMTWLRCSPDRRSGCAPRPVSVDGTG